MNTHHTPPVCPLCGIPECHGPHLCLGTIKLARMRAALAEHAADLAAQAADEEGVPELLMLADADQHGEVLEYMGLPADADLCDMLDFWDDAGPVQRVVILTILGAH